MKKIIVGVHWNSAQCLLYVYDQVPLPIVKAIWHQIKELCTRNSKLPENTVVNR